jgi:TonB-dependent starch-binding outer membrane protein SusC
MVGVFYANVCDADSSENNEYFIPIRLNFSITFSETIAKFFNPNFTIVQFEVLTQNKKRMTKFYLYLSRYLAVLLLLTSSVAWSQSRTVTGKVTASEDGSGIPGVNIVEKGTSNGTVSSADGSFSINTSEGSTLIFTFVGYKASEINVGSQTTVNVVLDADVTALSEVVVIGYGETKVKDATGAVVAVQAKDFNGGVISSPEQLIQGKTAGVQITSTSGSPGAGVQLRIRGTNSIRSNNNPLFVVDGVPLSGGTQPSAPDVGLGTISDSNPLNFINPSDIESINILKDASATAIYGSRGANGVVIITTKKGKGSKGALEFGSSISISSPAKKYDLLNRDQFLNAIEDFGTDSQTQDFGANTDWQDVVLRTSISNKQNLSYSKGFKTASLRASLGYEDQQGILENSYMKRLTGKLNGAKSFFNEKLNIDLSTTFSNVKREDPPLSSNAGSTGDILGAAYMANPTFPNDPTFSNTGGMRNPANMLKEYQSQGATNRILANISANYKITNYLTAKATYGYDGSKGERVTIVTGNAFNLGNNISGQGQGQLNENKSTSNLVELTLNYNKNLGNVIIDAVGGYSYQSFRNKFHWANAKGFSDFSNFGNMETEIKNSFDAADAAAGAIYGDYNNWGVSNLLKGGQADPTSGGFVNGVLFNDGGSFDRTFFARPAGVTVGGIAANFYDQTDFLQSYFGRANLTISDKYIITATLRADGSSRFGSDEQYGVFPSGAVAWKLHEEDFMPDFFTTLKLRAGYGIVGNQDGLGYGEFKRRERYFDVGVADDRSVVVTGTESVGSVNTKLKWESTAQAGVGIDFGIIGERLTGSVDYYSKTTSDLLLRRLAAQPSNQVQIFDNLKDATVSNKGWELSLTYAIIDKDDANFSISGNVAHNKNELKDFGGILPAGTIYGQGLSGAYAQLLAGGHPLFSYYVRNFQGFDANGQPIGDVQEFVGKSALPTWNMGLSLNAKYKQFDFSMYFAGQFGQYLYNNTKNAFFTAGSLQVSHNVTTDVLGNGESGGAEASVSTRFLEKGDFFRAQNLTLGYRLPFETSKAFKNLRLYFNAQNLFVITKYTGLDPEVSTNPADAGLLNNLPTAGIDYGAYPRPRTFTLGLNVSF